MDKTTAVAVSIDPFFVKVTEPPDETNVQVTCRNLDETGRIAEIGGPLQGGGTWKLSVPDVVSRIDDDGQRFFVAEPGGTEVDVITATGPRGRRYLKIGRRHRAASRQPPVTPGLPRSATVGTAGITLGAMNSIIVMTLFVSETWDAELEVEPLALRPWRFATAHA